MEREAHRVRAARAEDGPTLGRLLHDFNTEFDDPSPGPDFLAARITELIERGELYGFLSGEGPDGFCLFRFRPTLWAEADEAYLEELYAVPERRGSGIGQALVEATIAAARERGCARIDIVTSVEDEAARRLYERLGFSNREGDPDGPSMLYYDRDL